MNLVFQREAVGDITRLVLNIQEDMELDRFALNMIARNEINSLIPIQIVHFNADHFLQYDISNKNILASKLMGVLKKAEVVQILNSLIGAFEETEAYMLSDDNLYLDWNYIYLDDNNNCSLLYVPCVDGISINKLEFLQRLMEQIHEDFTERDPYIYDIRNAFSRGAIKKIADLKDLLKKNNNDVLASTVSEMSINSYESKPVSSVNTNLNIQQEPVNVNINAKPESKGGFSLNIPGKKSAPVEVPGKKSSSIPIPGKSNQGMAIPGKSEPVSVSGNSGVAFNIPGKSNASFSIPGKVVDPAPVAVTEKEPKKKIDMKIPDINLFGKKNNQAKSVMESDVQMPVTPMPELKSSVNNKEMYESYEQTVMMDVSSQTAGFNNSSVMPGNPMMTASLTRKKTGENIVISSGNWVIGSGSSASYCVADNKTISRNHATIQLQGMGYVFVDNNSSNGSYVDGRRVGGGEYIQLQNNSVIRLSDEDFIFRLS